MKIEFQPSISDAVAFEVSAEVPPIQANGIRNNGEKQSSKKRRADLNSARTLGRRLPCFIGLIIWSGTDGRRSVGGLRYAGCQHHAM